MGRGKRYNGSEHKLNMKKVVAVIIAILVIIMFIIILTKLAQPKAETTEKNVSMAYYTAFSNNKWGIIDSSGNTVIAPIYDEMIIVPNKEKAVFIVTYDVDYTNNTYKTKAVNEKNEQLFSTYEQVEVIQNYDKQNNQDVYRTITYQRAILNQIKTQKYIVVSMTSKRQNNLVRDDNNILKEEHKDHFLDFRTYLLTNGLKDANITATEQDQKDLTNSYIPSSLLKEDKFAGNDTFNQLLANQIYQKLQELHYIK